MPYAIRQALAAFRRTPVLTGLSAALVALSLFVVGLFAIAAFNVRRAVERAEERVEIVAYLHDDATTDAVRAARDAIAALPEVLDVFYISREQALEIARRELGELHTMIAELEANPLPASFQIRLRPEHRTAATVRAVAARIATEPVVEDVEYGGEWLDKVFLLGRIAGAATLVLGSAFAILAALIIGAAIRMAIYARRDEIAIMRLVGATDGFVRGPFLLEGLLTGLLGALLALPCVYLTFRLLSRSIVQLAWLPDGWIAAGIAAGAVLGLLASAVSVHRHLRDV